MKQEEVKNHTHSYLSFRIGHETFAVNVAQVLEILQVPQITKVPRSPSFMRGLINLRGNVLPVVDSRIKFGLETVADSINTSIIILSLSKEREEIKVGVLVDAVEEVFELSDKDLLPPPDIGGKYRTEFILGIARAEEGLIIFLDVDKIFSYEDVIKLKADSGDENDTEN